MFAIAIAEATAPLSAAAIAAMPAPLPVTGAYSCVRHGSLALILRPLTDVRLPGRIGIAGRRRFSTSSHKGRGASRALFAFVLRPSQLGSASSEAARSE